MDSHLTIAFVYSRFKLFHGAAHLILRFAHYLRQMGQRVYIITRGFDTSCRNELTNGIPVIGPSRLSSPVTGIHLVDGFMDNAMSPLLTRSFPHDVDVLCFVSSSASPAMWFYKRVIRGQLPCIYYCLQPPRFAYDLLEETVQGYKPLGHLVPLIVSVYRLIDRISASSCDALFTLSQEYAEWCRTLYSVDIIRAASGGVDLNRFNNGDAVQVFQKHGLAPDDRLVLTVNKLIPRKNLDIFIQIIGRLAEHVPSVKGIIVGDGPLRKRLEAYTAKLGLSERIIFTGFLPTLEEVADYYAACDVYVFLEKNVPFGLTIL